MHGNRTKDKSGFLNDIRLRSRAAGKRVLPWRELRRKRARKRAHSGANKNVSSVLVLCHGWFY